MTDVERVRAFFRAIDRHDVLSIVENLTEDVVLDNITLREPAQGKIAVAELYRIFLKAFPDLAHQLANVASASGDHALAEGTITGTMKGEFDGHPPSGRRIASRFATIFDLRGGKICALRAYYDNQSFMEQMLGSQQVQRDRKRAGPEIEVRPG